MSDPLVFAYARFVAATKADQRNELIGIEFNSPTLGHITLSLQLTDAMTLVETITKRINDVHP